MTCGYRNAAGTDLDSLFYSDFRNSGALGFRQPDGWDLGNKYTSDANLGYSVGYKAANGTDLGYLRGNAAPPVMVSDATDWHKLYDATFGSCSDTWEDAEGSHSASRRSRPMYGYVRLSAHTRGGGGKGQVWQVCACYVHKEGSYNHKYNQAFEANKTTVIHCPTICDGYSRLAANVEAPWVTVFEGQTGTDPSIVVAYGIEANDGRDNHKAYENFIRIYHRFYNDLGATQWRMHEFPVGTGDDHHNPTGELANGGFSRV